MYDITHIKNYILFLKNKCGLSLTLHPIDNERVIIPSELITFNIHDNSYCIYVKTFHSAHKHCVERQEKIYEKCADGSFCGTCYAGVREYVYPITDRNKTVGFICVSGYKSEDAHSYIRSAGKKYGMPSGELSEAYKTLKDRMPPKEEIDTLVRPLCEMLELAYTKCADESALDESFVDRVIRFVKQYHTQDISLSDICSHFACSKSHVSHQFKSRTGKSIREYLRELRVEDARSLLTYSELTVTEVAFSVGFDDSNYFSNVFKKQTGMSPMAYRKKMRDDNV